MKTKQSLLPIYPDKCRRSWMEQKLRGGNWRTSLYVPDAEYPLAGRKWEMGVHRNDKVFRRPETENAHPQCVSF